MDVPSAHSFAIIFLVVILNGQAHIPHTFPSIGSSNSVLRCSVGSSEPVVLCRIGPGWAFVPVNFTLDNSQCSTIISSDREMHMLVDTCPRQGNTSKLIGNTSIRRCDFVVRMLSACFPVTTTTSHADLTRLKTMDPRQFTELEGEDSLASRSVSSLLLVCAEERALQSRPKGCHSTNRFQNRFQNHNVISVPCKKIPERCQLDLNSEMSTRGSQKI